jgi:hypothetical protein
VQKLTLSLASVAISVGASSTSTQIAFKSDGTIPVNTLIRPVATAKY